MSQAITHGRGAHHYTDDRHYDGVYAVDRHELRKVYGGFKFGSAFFGWITASGIGVLLMSLLTAGGAALAVSSIQGRSLQSALNSTSGGTVQTIGIAGGILFLVALVIAYYAGGYVAGRMARFDGARQGFGVWLIGILVAIILGAAGAAFGAKYNVLQALNLPHLPIKASFTTGGLVTSLLALLVTLLAAVSGGTLGEGYHRKIEQASIDMAEQ